MSFESFPLSHKIISWSFELWTPWHRWKICFPPLGLVHANALDQYRFSAIAELAKEAMTAKSQRNLKKGIFLVKLEMYHTRPSFSLSRQTVFQYSFLSVKDIVISDTIWRLNLVCIVLVGRMTWSRISLSPCLLKLSTFYDTLWCVIWRSTCLDWTVYTDSRL